MRRLFWLFIIIFSLSVSPFHAQDALNLPSELYVLLNEGVVQRFGLGIDGVSQVTPDNEFVLDFRVAPDANWIAYRTEQGLFLRNIFDETGDSRQIEDERAGVPPLRGQGETIAWSPDSSAIAYTTEYGGRVHFFGDENIFTDLTTTGLLHLQWSPDGSFLAAEAEENVWWIFQRTDSVMILRAAIPGAFGGDWLTANQFLYAPVEGGMTILDLATSNQQIQILNTTATYYLPNVTRDGQIVAFTGEDEATANLLEITIDDNFLANGLPIGSAVLDVTGTRWTPDGFLLTAFQGGVLALMNPLNGNSFTLPLTSTSTYSWGTIYPPLVNNVPLPNNGYFLAADFEGTQQVWILPQEASPARPITAAMLDVTEFAISPNQTQVAYVSNSTLYLADLIGETEPSELVMLGINENIHPAWGPDNLTIYFRDEQGAEKGIWRITADTDLELFIADEDDAIFTEPNPALGVAAMLVNREGELALADTTSGEVTLLNIMGDAVWQNGTQFIAVGDARQEVVSGNGIYLVDANTTEQDPMLVLPLLGTLELYDYRVLNEATLRMLVQNQTPGDIRVVDVPRDGGQATLVTSIGYMVNPHLSSDGNFVIGQRTPNGVLLIYDVLNGTLQQIDVQAPISDFIWQ